MGSWHGGGAVGPVWGAADGLVYFFKIHFIEA